MRFARLWTKGYVMKSVPLDFSLIQIDRSRASVPLPLPMPMISRKDDIDPRSIENHERSRLFIYHADEVSLESLLDPKFRPGERHASADDRQGLAFEFSPAIYQWMLNDPSVVRI